MACGGCAQKRAEREAAKEARRVEKEALRQEYARKNSLPTSQTK